jgi:hypothetical protein
MADGQGLISQGLIAQALANLQTAREHLAAIGGLPAGAEAARGTVERRVGEVIPPIQGARQSVGGFVESATPLAGAAMAALGGGDAAAVERALAGMQAAAQPAKASVDAAAAAIQAGMGCVREQVAVLAQVEGALQQQISQASNELTLAQNAADELDKKKYYWLLLGPLGLPGLAACIAMIVTASQKVSGLQQRAGELRGQVAQWSKMKADVDLVVTELPLLDGKLQSLQNGIDFVRGDIAQVIEDVRKAGSGSAIARAYIMAAETELATLGAEVA